MVRRVNRIISPPLLQFALGWLQIHSYPQTCSFHASPSLFTYFKVQCSIHTNTLSSFYSLPCFSSHYYSINVKLGFDIVWPTPIVVLFVQSNFWIGWKPLFLFLWLVFGRNWNRISSCWALYWIKVGERFGDIMSEVFEGYERQYCELSTNLSRKCTSASVLDGGMMQFCSTCNASLFFIFFMLFFLCHGGFCEALVYFHQGPIYHMW